MKALVVREPNSIALEDRPTPVPGPSEVLISPMLVGICGTDLDIIDGRIDPTYVRYPLILGHEWSGIVAEAPSDSDLAPGDRVVVEGVIPCGHCAECAAGNTNRCETYDEFGFVRDGALTEKLVAPARLVHRLEPSVSLESGALVEPTAVVLRAILHAEPTPGQRVLVVGDGTVALIAVRLLRLWSPASITMLGRRPAQSELAAAAGADRFETDDTALTNDFDIVVEAAGALGAVQSAVAKAARGAKIVLLGFPGHGVGVPIVIDDIVNGDLTIIGSFSYTSTAWRRVVELLNTGRLELDFLVTHRYRLDQWSEAIDALRTATGVRGKVLVEISPN